MPQPSAELARRVRLLQCAEWALAALAVLMGGFAAFVIISDEFDHDDAWDGIGASLGLIIVGFSVVLLGLAAILLTLTAAGWRRVADRGATGLLRLAAAMAFVMALGWLCIAVALATDVSDPGLMFSILLPGPLLLWLALMVFVATLKDAAAD